MAPGCLIFYTLDNNAIALFNSAPEHHPCEQGSVIAGMTDSLVNLSLVLNQTSEMATITITGPGDVWFGVGIYADAMGDYPYTIVVDGNGAVTERKLGDHSPGFQLTPTQVKVLSQTVSNGRRTVILTRSLKGATVNHYSFSTTTSTFPFINAIGYGPDFSFHQYKTSASITLAIVENLPTCVCNDGIHGWINGIGFWKDCIDEPIGDLVQEKNPTCTIETYVGGLGCCHHQTILLDADQPVDSRVDTTYLKYRFYFQEYQPATPSTPASHHNLYRFYFQTEAWAGEYDVTPCPPNTPPSQCIQEITARWKVSDMIECDDNEPKCADNFTGINLIYAGGHCHTPSCISMELYNADNGQLLCRQTPVFGTGSLDRFDELGYVAIPPCLWGNEEGLVPPVYLPLTTNLLSVKKNNNTYGHYGEMASWQMRGIFL